MRIYPEIKCITDIGYQGTQKLHRISELLRKKNKKNLLTEKDKKKNQELSRERVVNEHGIGMLKSI